MSALWGYKSGQQIQASTLFGNVKNIDETLGLLQNCKLKDDEQLIATRFGKSPAGSFGSYQLAFQESNFTITSFFEPIQGKTSSETPGTSYPSLPLDDLNDDFVLNLPTNLDPPQIKLLDYLKVNLMDANKIEERTRAQHACEEWAMERKIRFTASKFGRIARRQKNHDKLCSDLLHAKPFRSQSTEHGIKYEPVAMRECQKYVHKVGHPIKVVSSGLFVSPKLFFIGCTSDEKFGLVEIKCPSDKNFFLEMNDIPKLKTGHKYYDQV